MKRAKLSLAENSPANRNKERGFLRREVSLVEEDKTRKHIFTSDNLTRKNGSTAECRAKWYWKHSEIVIAATDSPYFHWKLFVVLPPHESWQQTVDKHNTLDKHITGRETSLTIRLSVKSCHHNNAWSCSRERIKHTSVVDNAHPTKTWRND